MPTGRLLLILGAATLLVVAGILVPVFAWAVLIFDALMLAAFVVDLWRARRAQLAAERTWPNLLSQGSTAEIRVELRAENLGRTLHVQLRDELHPALSDAPRRTHLELVPDAPAATWTYDITPRRRGEHEAGALMARIEGPWRLARHQRKLTGGEPRRVYPQVRWDGKVGHLLLLAHRRSLGSHPQRLQGLGSEPYALREYLPGDPLNRIQWRASARHGRLVSREDTWERGARLLVLLDCARSMSGLSTTAAGDTDRRSKLDHALAAALALVRVAAARGDRVTLSAFSDRVERTVRVHGGKKSLQAAYSRIYDLDARRVEPAFDVAAETAVSLESRRSTVVLFTSVVDLAAAELLRRSVLRLERRHRPILINLQDPEIVALAEGAPTTPAEAFAKSQALEILLANRRLGTRLRHAGIRVVSTSADRLALEALEAYLAMFGGVAGFVRAA